MVDTFVLSMLSRPKRILDHFYYVVWDCKEAVAKIIYTQPPSLDFEYVLDKGQQVRVFESELEAHKYLNVLGMLNWKPDNLWRSI